ncbi:FAD-dependent oxidoreductase [Candidatus Woesearchaeota archaeon]|nr:FAD-dependent oxidoreductase [Candidatus Woesearchaeota archaeon]
MSSHNSQKKIVIVGGGFAGLASAAYLQQADKTLDITLIDRKEYHLFVPALTEYLGGYIDKKKITFPLKETLEKNNIRFVKGTFKAISPQKKEIAIEGHHFPYDYAVLALGSETNTFGIQGILEYTSGLKCISDADSIKKKIKDVCTTKKEISVAVIGGGITGVQLAAYLRPHLSKNYPQHAVSFTILDGAPRLLKELPEDVSKKIEDYFLNQKINMLFNAKVTKIEYHKIRLGERSVPADIIIWVAGVRPPKIIEKCGVAATPKGIIVDEYFRSITDQFVYAVGDCIAFQDETLEKGWVRRAQNAHKHARIVAANIIADIQKKEKITFKPTPIPTIVVLPHKAILIQNNHYFQNRLINTLDHCIRYRHMLFYKSRFGRIMRWLF